MFEENKPDYLEQYRNARQDSKDVADLISITKEAVTGKPEKPMKEELKERLLEHPKSEYFDPSSPKKKEQGFVTMTFSSAEMKPRLTIAKKSILFGDVIGDVTEETIKQFSQEKIDQFALNILYQQIWCDGKRGMRIYSGPSTLDILKAVIDGLTFSGKCALSDFVVESYKSHIEAYEITVKHMAEEIKGTWNLTSAGLQEKFISAAEVEKTWGKLRKEFENMKAGMVRPPMLLIDSMPADLRDFQGHHTLQKGTRSIYPLKSDIHLGNFLTDDAKERRRNTVRFDYPDEKKVLDLLDLDWPTKVDSTPSIDEEVHQTTARGMISKNNERVKIMARDKKKSNAKEMGGHLKRLLGLK